MKEEKHIDKFFADRLQKIDGKDDNWAMPSDDVWEAAQTRFNPPKKEKRRFFWFFFGLAPLLIFGYALVYFLPNSYKNVEKPTENNILVANSNFENKNARINDHKTIISPVFDLNQRNSDIALNPIEKIQQHSSPSSTEAINSIPGVDIPNIIEQSTQRSVQERSRKSTYPSKEAHQSASTKSNQLKNPTINQLETGPVAIEIKRGTERKINPLVTLSPYLMYVPKLVPSPNLSQIKPIRIPKRKSLGLSHLLAPITYLEEGLVLEDGNKDDIINLTLNYKNINVHYDQWLGKKWSFSTGAYLSKISVDFNFSVFDTLNEDLSTFVNREVGGVTPRSKLSDTNFITLKDNAEVNPGDLINIQAAIVGDLYALQIPLHLRRHWYKGNFDIYFGVGASLDILRYDFSPFEIDIYKDDEIINEPLINKEENGTVLDFSLYTNLGFQLPLKNNLHIGINLRASILEPYLSGIESGIYYRWP